MELHFKISLKKIRFKHVHMTLWYVVASAETSPNNLINSCRSAVSCKGSWAVLLPLSKKSSLKLTDLCLHLGWWYLVRQMRKLRGGRRRHVNFRKVCRTWRARFACALFECILLHPVVPGWKVGLQMDGAVMDVLGHNRETHCHTIYLEPYRDSPISYHFSSIPGLFHRRSAF